MVFEVLTLVYLAVKKTNFLSKYLSLYMKGYFKQQMKRLSKYNLTPFKQLLTTPSYTVLTFELTLTSPPHTHTHIHTNL